jgi:hypothetical protein
LWRGAPYIFLAAMSMQLAKFVTHQQQADVQSNCLSSTLALTIASHRLLTGCCAPQVPDE